MIRPVLLLAAMAAAPAFAEAPVTRIAVYDFEISGYEPRVARIVTDAVLVELRKLEGLSVLGMDEVRAMLSHEAQKQLAGCTDDSCLSDIADALGVDGLVTGSIARVEAQAVFGMKRIDQRRAATVGSVVRRLEAQGGEELLAAVGPAVEELFPEFPLKPGQTRGVDAEVALRLRPPPIPLWALTATAGTALALAVGAGAAFGAFGLLQLDYTSFAASGTKDAPIRAADLQQKGALVVGAYGTAATLGALSALVATTAGVLSLFTDFAGYGSEVSE